MKSKLYHSAMILISLLILGACQENDNLDPVGEWTLSSPELLKPDAGMEFELDAERPNQSFFFEWEPAVSSANYEVSYSIVLDTTGSQNYADPIASFESSNSGRDNSGEISAAEIDEALSYAGYTASETAQIEWAVIAKSLDSTSTAHRSITFKRFDIESAPVNLYLSGQATEAGEGVSNGIAFSNLSADGNQSSGIFEIYTALEANQNFRMYDNQSTPARQYGGTNGVLAQNGDDLQVDESGQYRITVNFNNNTYALLKIDKFSIVGNIIPNGWGGDEAMQYAGNGVWQGEFELSVPEGEEGAFVFRANENWDYLFKKIEGTSNQVFMESQAEEYGVSIMDIPLAQSGNYIVTLDLSAMPYTYSMEVNETVTPPSDVPNNLFLIDEDGSTVTNFSKDGAVFSSEVFVPLQESYTYTLNSSEDGTGTEYASTVPLGQTEEPTADRVSNTLAFGEGGFGISVMRDQGYRLTVNFDSEMITWTYYNFKLFHWNESAEGGWDARVENNLNYQHPLTFTANNISLEAGFDSKFFSPWDYDFGSLSPQQLSGQVENGGGNNFNNVDNSGDYQVILQLDPSYETGSYEFIPQ